MFRKTNLSPWRGPFGLFHGRRPEEHPLDVFRSEFDRLFEDLWRGFEVPMMYRYEQPFGAMAPRMDVVEDEDRFRVSLELPGMDEKDIELVLRDDVLTVRGEKQAEEEVGRLHPYMERAYGSFQRSIPLDAEIVRDKIEARFDKGVLTIDLPKSAEAKKSYRKIPIHAAGKVKKLERKAA